MQIRSTHIYSPPYHTTSCPPKYSFHCRSLYLYLSINNLRNQSPFKLTQTHSHKKKTKHKFNQTIIGATIYYRSFFAVGFDDFINVSRRSDCDNEWNMQHKLFNCVWATHLWWGAILFERLRRYSGIIWLVF